MLITIIVYVAMADLFWNKNVMTFVLKWCQLKDDVSTCRKMWRDGWWPGFRTSTSYSENVEHECMITWVHPLLLVGSVPLINLVFFVVLCFWFVLCLVFPMLQASLDCLFHSWLPIRFSLTFISYWAKV
jgi:hypothetical protein